MSDVVAFSVDGRPVSVSDDGCSLLEALRDRLAIRSPKDGCSPQGQCGCCTVLVDGQPRVACVTPARRVAGRAVTTVDGLPDARGWAEAFTRTGASQCGFCSPGIIVRLAALSAGGPVNEHDVDRALLAHLCRCTGWQTIREAALGKGGQTVQNGAPRDLEAAARRATIEGGRPQRVQPEVALGRGGFADDTAPEGALVAVLDGAGGWVVGGTVVEARRKAGKVQGRRTTAALRWPLDVPPGAWERTLRTTWVEPAYLETDAAWCEPGGTPTSPLANGGAFGGKEGSGVAAAARALADEHGRPVRVLYAREDAVRRGPKRPPIAAGVRADGTGELRVVRTDGIAAAITAVAPGLVVEEVEVPGPPTSSRLRAAGWAEAAVLAASLTEGADGWDQVRSPGGAVAWAIVDERGVRVTVRCGDPLDEVVLRSYCIGAAHMALGWVRHEGIAVDEEGECLDLTVRSFGVLRAGDTPRIEVTVLDEDAPPVNGSDAVFAAVAAAAWRHAGFPAAWPTR